MPKSSLTSISIIVSVYNEEAVILSFWEELKRVLSTVPDLDAEVLFVNDGSADNSLSLIKEIMDTHEDEKCDIVLIDFSRNFGHEAAMIAGIDAASKEALVCLDSDLQHPPEKIIDMIAAYNKGYEVVTMVRDKRHDNGMVKNFLSAFFYKFLNYLSTHKFDENASDFFMISSRVAKVLRENFRESNRFLRGYIQSVGFSKTSVRYEAPERLAGESSYSFLALVRLSFGAIFTFSNKPLQMALMVSVLFSFFTIGIIAYSLYEYFWGATPPSGYTTLIIFQSLGFTVLFLLIAILSMYFGKSLDEMRGRPIYIINELTKTSQRN